MRSGEGSETSRRMAHSSPPEEEKLGFPFSENGPSEVEGHADTSPFSDLGEWDSRGVTTPIALPYVSPRVTCLALALITCPVSRVAPKTFGPHLQLCWALGQLADIPHP